MHEHALNLSGLQQTSTQALQQDSATWRVKRQVGSLREAKAAGWVAINTIKDCARREPLPLEGSVSTEGNPELPRERPANNLHINNRVRGSAPLEGSVSTEGNPELPRDRPAKPWGGSGMRSSGSCTMPLLDCAAHQEES